MTGARAAVPPLLGMIRGPMGARKSTLVRGLARSTPHRFWALDTDAATAFHPSDPYGEHLATEWPLEIEILTLDARITLGRGFNLVLDPGILLTARDVNRFLRGVGRSRSKRRVVLFRLTGSPTVAADRKRNLPRDHVLDGHRGWQPHPIPGEIVIDTDRRTRGQVLATAKRRLGSCLSARGTRK